MVPRSSARAATPPVDQSQRTAAKVVGLTYLFVNAASIFGELYARSPLIVWDNPAQTAHNIMGSETLFRISIASDLATFAGDVILAAAFYVLLSPVSKGIALAGSFFRLAMAASLGVITLNLFIALRLLSGASYLGAFRADQLQALTRLFLGVHDYSYLIIGVLFFSIGSTCSSYLLLKSRYIPRPLAGLGVLASLLAFVYVFAVIIFPDVPDVVELFVYIPLLVFEVLTGLWLLFKGISPREAAAP